MNNVDTEGAIDFASTRRVPRDAVRDLDKFLIAKGDVMFNNTNSPELVGKSAVFRGFREPVVFSNHFTRIRTRTDRLEPRYLARWLASEWRQGRFARMCNQWVNQAAVPRAALLAMELPVPSLQVQGRIADILDKADAIRRKRKQAIALTEELLRSAFLDMFGDPVTNPMGWPRVPLGEAVEFLDHMRRPITASERTTGPYPYYGANGQQDSVAGYIFDEPLILLAEDGGHFDEPDRGIAYGVTGKCWVNNHAHVLRPRSGYDFGFLCAHLARYDVTEFVNGTTRAKLTKGAAERIPLLSPPREVQGKFSRASARLAVARSRLAEAIVDAETLFSSLAARVFSGPLEIPC
jgi:type I restriction enzyme S subunit